MWTLIIYDGSAYYQATVNLESVADIRKLMPRDHDLMFAIPDDVEVLDEDTAVLISRTL